mgnify:CR=1 FL=1
MEAMLGDNGRDKAMTNDRDHGDYAHRLGPRRGLPDESYSPVPARAYEDEIPPSWQDSPSPVYREDPDETAVRRGSRQSRRDPYRDPDATVRRSESRRSYRDDPYRRPYRDDPYRDEPHRDSYRDEPHRDSYRDEPHRDDPDTAARAESSRTHRDPYLNDPDATAPRAESRGARRAAESPDTGPSFGRALGWTVLGSLVPGTGLIRAGRKAAGVTALLLVGLAVGAVGFLAMERNLALSAAVSPNAMMLISGALILLALVWAAMIRSTYLSLRPRRLNGLQRVVGSGLVATLVFGISAPMAVGAVYTYEQASLLQKIFTNDPSGTRPTLVPAKGDPWAGTPRLNVLLVGGDYGSSRPEADKGYGENTDTMILASIDTRTGNTVLISVPRNMEKVPFPKDSPLHKYYPNGFPKMANAIWADVKNEVPKDALGPTANFGADALKLGLGEALGQKIDYYVYLNIDGLYGLIDAMGGVEVNVNERIPIAGSAEGKRPTGYIEPGENKKLNAYEAMWYARSRSGSVNGDFDRMGRQRCVINAIVKQTDPQTLLTRYEGLAKASSKMVRTDIPQDVLPMMIDLGVRMRNGQHQSMQFTNGVNGFVSANPNYATVRAQVAEAIAQSTAPAEPAPTTAAPAPETSAAPAPTPSASTGRRTTATRTTPAPAPATSASPVAQNMNDACKFDPAAAAKATASAR